MKTRLVRKTLCGCSVAVGKAADTMQTYSSTFGISRVFLVAAALSFASLSAQTVVNVDSAVSLNPTGIFLHAGERAFISATGTVNLAAFDGSYITDPNGTIVVAPLPGTGAYNYFTLPFPPGPPVVGGMKTYLPPAPPNVAVYASPYGALVAVVTAKTAPTPSDFPSG